MEQTLLFLMLGFMWLGFAIEKVLGRLQARWRRKPIPENLKDVYDEEEYKKSQAYAKDLGKVGRIQSWLMFVISVTFLGFGGFGWLSDLLHEKIDQPIFEAWAFFGILATTSGLFGLPFGWYRTFRIEEKYGFNKSTPKIFWTDQNKGAVLGALFGGAILAVLVLNYQLLGDSFWIFAWVFLTGISLIMATFYTSIIVPWFNKLTPLEDEDLKAAIQAYAEEVDFPLKRIMVMDGSKRTTKANAFFTGLGRMKQIVLFDNLVNDFEKEEIVAVLAHEVGHYKRRHIPQRMVISVLQTGLLMFILGLFLHWEAVAGALGAEASTFHLSLVGFALLWSPVSTLSGILFNWWSRKMEFEADAFAGETYSAQPLINALKRLAKKSLSNLTPHPAYVFVHYSHPPMAERVKALNSKAEN